MFFSKPKIEFLCYEEDLGNIPEPYPAKKLIPEWFKALPMRMHPGLDSGTVKRCPPFLDAMTTGWIIPLAADVEIKTNSDCSGIEYKWEFNKTMIQNHHMDQVSTEKSPNPTFPKPPIKFLNWWAIRCPPGYSLLFMPPLNRTEKRFTCFSGMVEADKYFEFINFPFVWNVPNFHGILPAGTPLVQVFPIKRDTLFGNTIIRSFNKKDLKDLNDTRQKRKSRISYYRDELWEKKK